MRLAATCPSATLPEGGSTASARVARAPPGPALRLPGPFLHLALDPRTPRPCRDRSLCRRPCSCYRRAVAGLWSCFFCRRFCRRCGCGCGFCASSLCLCSTLCWGCAFAAGLWTRRRGPCLCFWISTLTDPCSALTHRVASATANMARISAVDCKNNSISAADIEGR